MVRVLIADADETASGTLRRILESDRRWQVCAEASTGPQAVEIALRLSPDITVLNLAMPEMNGLQATHQIKKALPNTEVLILMIHETDDLIRDLLVAGARGCLLKANAEQQIAAAVDALSQHRPYLTGKARQAVLDAYLATTDAERGPFAD